MITRRNTPLTEVSMKTVITQNHSQKRRNKTDYENLPWLRNKLQTKDSTVGGSLNYRLVDSMTMDSVGQGR